MKKLKLLTVVVSALVLTACGGGVGSAANDTLTFVAYGGTTQENVMDVFVKPYANVDTSKLYSMVDAKNATWDLVNLEPWYSQKACTDGKAEKIPAELIESTGLPAEYHGDCWMASWSFSFALVYRKSDFTTPPTSWADFYDTAAFPGKRGLWSWYQGGQLESALMADGVAPEDVFPMDIDRAVAKISSIKKDVIFSDSLQEMVQQLVSGETSMAIVLSGRAAAQIKEGTDLGIVWNGQIIGPDSYMIPNGAPNPEAAHGLIKEFLDIDRLVEFAHEQFYGPALPEAQAKLADSPDCPLINTCGDNAETAVIADTDFWVENEAAVSTAWDKLLGR
jgi:putative spermidine/putrescine transport system substrate-binding protein